MSNAAAKAAPPTQRWTLALDESGRFEGKAVAGEGDERGGWVVGGVLLPGSADDSHRALDGFRRFCLDMTGRWPPHASEHSPERRLQLAQAAGDELRQRQGVWIFVVTRARGASRAGALGRYVRMFGATIDFAGRLTAALGGSELDVRPAHRSVPLDGTGLFEATNLGVVAPMRGTADEKASPHAMLEAETRHALDALAREPAGALGTWPALASVIVEYANRPSSHAGISLADVGCNRVYGGLWSDAKEPLADRLAPLAGAPIFVIELDALRSLRALDRALRHDPPDLLAAARVLAGLRANERAADTTGRVDLGVARGAVAAGERLWQHGLHRLARHAAPPGLATALAAAAEVDLSLKKGAYEGTWLALDAGWAGRGALADAVRNRTSDRVLATRLWRLTLECANHRGDVPAALAAATAFDAGVAPGRSYRLLGEELLVRNLTVVARQNVLPASAADADVTRAALADDTDRLVRLLDEAEQVLGLAVGAEPPPPETADSADEQRLWAAITGAPPRWAAPDRERGMGHGTVARSLAFLGRLSEATAAALRARGLFVDSPFDRGINAAVLARILLESARLGQPVAPEALDAALALCGASARRGSTKVADLTADPALRFALDIALRALLWGPAPKARAPLLELLTGTELLDRLAQTELRSHPTELVARHAGELLRRHGAPAATVERWFSLSVALTDEAAPDSTLRRLGVFTRRLASDAKFVTEGAPGSILNPTFEYR